MWRITLGHFVCMIWQQFQKQGRKSKSLKKYWIGFAARKDKRGLILTCLYFAIEPASYVIFAAVFAKMHNSEFGNFGAVIRSLGKFLIFYFILTNDRRTLASAALANIRFLDSIRSKFKKKIFFVLSLKVKNYRFFVPLESKVPIATKTTLKYLKC